MLTTLVLLCITVIALTCCVIALERRVRVLELHNADCAPEMLRIYLDPEHTDATRVGESETDRQ